MNTATNDETKTKTVSHNGVNGRNGHRNGRTAIHELTILGTASSPRIPSTAAPLSLPVPVFPRHPEKCGNVEPDPNFFHGTGIPIALA